LDIPYVSEPDDGIYDAMNKGLERANGQFVIFMNAGDVFATPYILETIAEQTELKPDFIYGDSLEENNGKLFYKRAKPYSKIKYGMFTHHQAMIYARRTIGDMRFDTQYKIAADYDFTWRFLEKAKRPVYILEEPLCIFEGGGVSQQNAKLGRQEQKTIRETRNILSPILNTGLYVLQSFVWKVRNITPRIFWAFKN
jgi:putative colanic acid biosynthesis glycosyltransferase